MFNTTRNSIIIRSANKSKKTRTGKAGDTATQDGDERDSIKQKSDMQYEGGGN